MIADRGASLTTAPLQALRILFLTLEFRAGTFSGNGVYATAQVRALAAAGHKVFVISAQPLHAKTPEDDFGVDGIIEIPVSSWHRLDAGAPWREFAAGALDSGVTGAIRAFAPDVVLAVDWSALQAVRHLKPYCGRAPYIYLNYRVFSRTAVGEDLELIRGLEAAAMAESALTVALSRSDAEYLATQVAGKQAGPDADEGPPAVEDAAATISPPTADLQRLQEGELRQEQPAPTMEAGFSLAGHPERAASRQLLWMPKVLLPALREDVRELEPPSYLAKFLESGGVPGGVRHAVDAEVVAAASSRPYLSCVVRLSPEKEPERFVELVEAMAAQGLLERHNLTPLLLGVANDEYAQGLKARLRAAAPSSIILERFVGPRDLADIYRQTRINFHPSTYDAYGMTIVEAASQGAPSVVHDGDGAVGATDLLHGGDAGEVFLLDLKAPTAELAAGVGRILTEPGALAETSVRALRKARSWDEAANAAALIQLVREAMTQCRAPG